MIHCCFCFVCARNYTELHCLRLCGSSAVMCLAIFLKLFCRGIYFFLPSSQELTVHFCPAVVDFNPYKKYINWEDKHWTVTACSCSGTIAVHLTWGLLERGTFASQACAVQSWLDQFRKKITPEHLMNSDFFVLNLESPLCFKFISKASYTSFVRLIRRVVWFNFGD